MTVGEALKAGVYSRRIKTAFDRAGWERADQSYKNRVNEILSLDVNEVHNHEPLLHTLYNFGHHTVKEFLLYSNQASASLALKEAAILKNEKDDLERLHYLLKGKVGSIEADLKSAQKYVDAIKAKLGEK